MAHMSQPAAALDILKAPGKFCGSCCSLLCPSYAFHMKRYLNNSCHFLTSGTLDGSNGTLALLPGRLTRWLPIYSQDRLQRSVPEPLRQWVSLPSPSSPISSMCQNCYKIIIHPHHSHNSQLCAFRPSSLHHPVFPQVSSQPSCIGLFSGCGSHI